MSLSYTWSDMLFTSILTCSLLEQTLHQIVVVSNVCVSVTQEQEYIMESRIYEIFPHCN